MQSLLSRSFEDQSLLVELKNGTRLTPEKQLNIYRRNINGAYQNVLAQVYPACRSILGNDYFNQLCRLYRFEYPSTDYDLNTYGYYFSRFLADHINSDERLCEYAYLEDLATLEWHWHLSYFARDDTPFDYAGLEKLTTQQQTQLVFQLSSSFSLHISMYPIITIWLANHDKPDTRQEFEHDGNSISFCIFRKQYEPQIEELNRIDYAYLHAIDAGTPLEQLIDEFGSKFSLRLPIYIQNGWISGFEQAS